MSLLWSVILITYLLIYLCVFLDVFFVHFNFFCMQVVLHTSENVCMFSDNSSVCGRFQWLFWKRCIARLVPQKIEQKIFLQNGGFENKIINVFFLNRIKTDFEKLKMSESWSKILNNYFRCRRYFLGYQNFFVFNYRCIIWILDAQKYCISIIFLIVCDTCNTYQFLGISIIYIRYLLPCGFRSYDDPLVCRLTVNKDKEHALLCIYSKIYNLIWLTKVVLL